MGIVEPLSYETLRKRQQAERASPKLTRLEGDFYRNLETYLKGLSEDYQREQATNPGSSKATLIGDELQNTRRLAEDLYEQRERKVVTAALTAGRGANPEHQHMLREEQELFEALLGLLRETKRRVLHGGPRAPAPASAPAATAPDAAPPSAEPAGRVLVRVLEDIGAFAASDLRTYHVKRDDVLDLPADTAKILVLRGKAVEVAPVG
ncbi:MAG TPA: hypothetical protein VGR28_03970 [Candidatus Thermoplasmatota archaeon]|jgi:DNA replication initiation complex subunit (GINS family)|nr:hypothetical protein [Candidatus Thermoplasmatota archaeon]